MVFCAKIPSDPSASHTLKIHPQISPKVDTFKLIIYHLLYLQVLCYNIIMIKKLLKFVIKPKENTKKIPSAKMDRLLLEKKVEQGTDFAIKEYGDVFKMLAEYDRT